jgi:hypothetical protein
MIADELKVDAPALLTILSAYVRPHIAKMGKSKSDPF